MERASAEAQSCGTLSMSGSSGAKTSCNANGRAWKQRSEVVPVIETSWRKEESAAAGERVVGVVPRFHKSRSVAVRIGGSPSRSLTARHGIARQSGRAIGEAFARG